MAKLKLTNITIVLSILLALLLIINISLTASINQKLKKEIEKAIETKRPAKIELKVIEEKSCKECNISDIINLIKSSNLNITSEKIIDFSEGKGLIEKYNITKLPAVIISGEIEKSGLNFEKRNDVFIYESTPPYFEIKEGKIKGLVELTVIKDSNCDNCYDIDIMAEQIKNIIRVVKENRFDSKEKEAIEIIKKYNITKIPTLILSQDAALYPIINKAWAQVGSIEEDGSLVLKEINPPYLDLNEKRIRGLVNLIMLNDSSCNECYNVSLHKQILKNLGIAIANETVYDINSENGKAVVSKYKITKAPTILLSGELSLYSSFNQIWKQVGSIETDGTYVFRNMEAIKGGIYKDLENNTVIGK